MGSKDMQCLDLEPEWRMAFFKMSIVKLSNNAVMWVSPGKRLETGAMNKNTSKALEKILRLCL